MGKLRRIWCKAEARAASFGRSERGAVAVLAGVMLPVLLLAAGLWVETGYWYQQQRKVQHAADVAAYAVGVRIRAGDKEPRLTDVAEEAAEMTGVNLASTAIPVDVNYPYNGDKNRVEVLVTETHERYLTALLQMLYDPPQWQDRVTTHGRAVVKLVGYEGTSGCVLSLSSTKPGALSVAGSTNVQLKGCDLSSNSADPAQSFSASGSAVLTANCVRTVGGTSISASVTLTSGCPIRFAPPARDPYADVPMPSVSGLNCADEKFTPGKTVELGGTYSAAYGTNVRCFKAAGANGAIDIKGTVRLLPGLYIFDSGLRFTAGTNGEPAELTGDGVTLFFTDGNAITLNGQAKLTLTPPTPANQPLGSTNPYMGISILGDRKTGLTETFQINGPENFISVQGAIYAPSSAVNYSGNSTTATNWTDASTTNDGCTQIIADTVSFTGSSQLASDCQAMATQPLYSYETVELDQ